MGVIIFFLTLFLIAAVYHLLKDREQRFHTVTTACVVALWMPLLALRVLAAWVLLRSVLGADAGADFYPAVQKMVLVSILPECVAIVAARLRKIDFSPPLDDPKAQVRRSAELFSHFYFTRRAERRGDIRAMAWLLGTAGLLGTATIALHVVLIDPVTAVSAATAGELELAALRAMLASASVLLIYAVYYLVHGYKAPLPPDPFADTITRKSPPIDTHPLRGRGLSTGDEAERDWMEDR